jgi:phospholipase/lecithinase/hemolysin
MSARYIFTAVLGLAPILAQSAGSSPTYASIVVFGDSFSDNGNGSYKLTNGTWPSNPAYYDGRFSDGPVWCEDVASNLSIPLYDYAYGGATTSNELVQGYTGPDSTVPVPGVAEQVSTFLSNNSDDTDFNMADSLFVVFGGFNDIFFNPNLTAAQIAAALNGSITTLKNAGARHFLTMNYYDASLIPYDSFTDVAGKEALAEFSTSYGEQLSMLSQKGACDGSTITYVDLQPVFRHFYYYGEPASYGFAPFGAYGSCLVGAYSETPNTTLCADPDVMVFWDEYHPSKRTHGIIAETVLGAL